MYSPNEDSIKSLTAPYQQRIYALVLYLVGQDRDTAYHVCASSFTEALQENSAPEQKDIFLSRLIGIAVEKCRHVKTIPTLDALELLEIADAEKGPLRIVLKAFQALDFDAKVLVLLRDQLNLSYRQIATIMRSSESRARSEVTRARARLRKMIEDTLNDA